MGVGSWYARKAAHIAAGGSASTFEGSTEWQAANAGRIARESAESDVRRLNAEIAALKKEMNKNPNPSNWKIEMVEQVGGYVILWLKYPDCTNYEGNKILMYEAPNLVCLINQKELDPHFQYKKGYYSPIARFEPTEKGWKLALMLASSSTLTTPKEK